MKCLSFCIPCILLCLSITSTAYADDDVEKHSVTKRAEINQITCDIFQVTNENPQYRVGFDLGVTTATEEISNCLNDAEKDTNPLYDEGGDVLFEGFEIGEVPTAHMQCSVMVYKGKGYHFIAVSTDKNSLTTENLQMCFIKIQEKIKQNLKKNPNKFRPSTVTQMGKAHEYVRFYFFLFS